MTQLITLMARHSGMDTILAVRNLIHDRLRLAVTLVGIIFAVVLVIIQIGLFLGFAGTTSSIIDHARADLWIMAEKTRDVDQAAPISERKMFQALVTPGVAHAAQLIVDFTFLKRADGGTESVLIVGCDLQQSLCGPWNIVEGDVRDLRFPDTIMIDDLYREKLGVTHIGQSVEIGGRRAQIVGFTHGLRSFTQSPYVFSSVQTARDYAPIRDDQTKYVLVSLKPGADLETVRAALERRISNVEVHSRASFSRITQNYWMFTTGAGLALLVAAVMGLAVGSVVVSQTLYATTVDHLPEFATLRALGASNRYIYGVIIRQALASGIVGYVAGLLIAMGIIMAGKDIGPALLLPAWLAIGMFFVTLAMCVGAAIFSISKITRLDPSMVFAQ